jgi:O-antigen/teichoic acid export membrane protein
MVTTQAIAFLLSPLLSRIFRPEDFGGLANYNAWVSIFALVSSLRYEQAIILAKGRHRTNQVIVLTLALSAVAIALVSVAAAAIHFLYTGGGYLGAIRGIVPLMPAGVLVVCVSSLFTQHNVKTGRFRRLALIGIVQMIVTIVAQILLGVAHVAHALIIGTIAGYSCSSVVFAALFFRRSRLSHLTDAMTVAGLRDTAVIYANFPKFALAADGINVAIQQFIPVFILALFNPVYAGVYSFASRIVRTPLVILATAITGALRKEAADRVHRGESLAALYADTTRSLFVLGILPFIVALLFGRQIFALIFGEPWADAGRVVQILSPGILLEFIAVPLSAFLLVTQNQRYTFRLQSLAFVLLLAALFLGRYYLGDFVASCYLISIAMVVANLSTILLAAQVTTHRFIPWAPARLARSIDT